MVPEFRRERGGRHLVGTDGPRLRNLKRVDAHTSRSRLEVKPRHRCGSEGVGEDLRSTSVERVDLPPSPFGYDAAGLFGRVVGLAKAATRCGTFALTFRTIKSSRPRRRSHP